MHDFNEFCLDASLLSRLSDKHVKAESAEVSPTVSKKQQIEKYGILYEKLTGSDGEHYVVEIPKTPSFDRELRECAGQVLSQIFKELLKKYRINKDDNVLVVGIGNEGMTADALGAKTLRFLEITEHFYKEGIMERGKGRLSCIAGFVPGVTGITSFDVIKGVAEQVEPSVIIAVDTLATRYADRLARVIQISDSGITPGSGVGNARRSLDALSLGVPVIAVGVPFVIYAKNIAIAEAERSAENEKASEEKFNDLVLTPKDVDLSVDAYARIIAAGINQAVHG
jgi:spore protease